MIRTQISVDKKVYEQAKKLARNQDISLAELCRRSLQEVVSKEPTNKPWMSFAGIFDGNESDSSSIDSIVYDRESP